MPRRLERLRRRRVCSVCHQLRKVDSFPNFDPLLSDEEGYETADRLICSKCLSRPAYRECSSCGKLSRRAAADGKCKGCASAPQRRECRGCRLVRNSSSFHDGSDLCRDCLSRPAYKECSSCGKLSRRAAIDGECTKCASPSRPRQECRGCYTARNANSFPGGSDLCRHCLPFTCQGCGKTVDPATEKIPKINGYVARRCMQCVGRRNYESAKNHAHHLLVSRLRSGKARARALGLPADSVSVDDVVAIFRAQGGVCPGCQSALPTSLDHIAPLSNGGGHVIANLQFLCPGCNALKSDGTMEDLAARRAAYLDYFGSLL